MVAGRLEGKRNNVVNMQKLSFKVTERGWSLQLGSLGVVCFILENKRDLLKITILRSLLLPRNSSMGGRKRAGLGITVDSWFFRLPAVCSSENSLNDLSLCFIE